VYDPKPNELILPCDACHDHAIIGYAPTDLPTDSRWLCPWCGHENRLRLRGKLTDVMRHPVS